ncbi:MAG: family 10 glycosylhydrolase [Thermoguttaceae bacterium]|nr:family 10 glycosylhydrolase [Thermoguttaceae bacterium]
MKMLGTHSWIRIGWMLCGLLMGIGSFANAGETSTRFAETEVRGAWVATVSNINWPSKPGLSDAEQQAEAVQILEQAQTMGLNLVVFQVRPAGDAFYPSKFFPWSKYLTGVQGQKAPGYDPLRFWIEQSHRRGIALHAWINPYRISTGGAVKDSATGEWKADLSGFCEGHPALKHPDWVVPYADGKMYFDPGNPAARKYILDAAMEIVKNYDVDGIHMDDYFYPYPKNDANGKRIEFGDAKTFAKYGKKFDSIHDWRQDNVSVLLRELHKKIQRASTAEHEIVFGVSPFAIWRNRSGDPRGSETSGLASCDAIYADSLTWVENGYIDYITPQVYWAFETKAAPYDKVADWWIALCRKHPQVKLVIGMGAHRIGTGGEDDPWQMPDQFSRQLEYNQQHQDVVRGQILFGWTQFSKNPLGCVDTMKKMWTK